MCGLLYLVPEADDPLLDAAQGSYEKMIQEVELFPTDFPRAEDDTMPVRVVPALVYLDTEGGDPGTPGKEHVKEVNDAVGEAVVWGMPTWYVERASRYIPLNEREKEEREAEGKEKAELTG